MQDFKNGTLVNLSSGGQAKVISKLGEGGQGAVYKVLMNGKEYALKWYLTSYIKSMGTNVDRFYSNLQNNVAAGSPSKEFLWPIDVTKKEHGSFGYLMDLYPSNVKSFSRYLNASVRFKSTEAVINATLNMVKAFQALHQKGFSYQDINDGNFSVDPETGEVLICDNDNVAPYGENFGIGGKSRYMAPEVVLGTSKPNSDTDAFSLSVVLFMFFFLSHPLEGAKVASCPCLTDKYEKRYYAESPLFIFDPQCADNRPVRGIHNNAIVLWPLFPEYLQEAFIRAFTKGAKDPSERLTEQEWKKLFYRLQDDMIICPKCGEQLFASMAQKGIITCSDCRHSMQAPLLLCGKNTSVALSLGKKISGRSFSGMEERKIIAEVIANKKNPALWGLRNLSDMQWLVTMPDGSRKVIENDAVTPIFKDIEIEFDGKTLQIK